MADIYQNPFVNDSSLKLYLPFDGNSNDYTGIYNGTDTNISYVESKINNGASFNGTSSKIVLPLGIESYLTTNFTISFWLNLNSYGTNARIFGNQIDSIKTGQFSIVVKDSLTDKIEFIFYKGSDLWATINTTVAPTLNTWELYTFVKSGTTAYIYKNGNKNATVSTFPSTLTVDNTTPCTFGQFTGGIQLLDGKLDEFLILNRALSSGEIQMLYSSYISLSKFGEFLPTSNTLNYFKFNGNSVNTIGNIASTDYNMTYVPGRFGQCASFNGTNGRISNVSYALTTFTYSSWVKITSTGGYLYVQGPSTDNANIEINIVGTKIQFQMWNGTAALNFTSNKILNDGIWHNLVITRNGSTVIMYVDGSYDNKRIDMYTYTVGYSKSSIGGHFSNVAYMTGQIDEMIIENTVWTPEQVRKYYTNSLGRYAIL